MRFDRNSAKRDCKRGFVLLLAAVVATVLLSLAGPAGPAWAVPSLQLDIEGGTYDPGTQTIITKDPTFTLYALLVPDGNKTFCCTDSYFISIALVPPLITATSLGSFVFDGTPINVTVDMELDSPPIDMFAQTYDGGDLPPHGIFPTFFSEILFMFDSNDTTAIYNTQDMPGGIAGGGLNPSSGTEMFFRAFDVDASNLASGVFLHFDLYNTKDGNHAVDDTDILKFAPFSHDAAYVPEPSTVLLLGSGLAGLGLWRLRRRKNA